MSDYLVTVAKRVCVLVTIASLSWIVLTTFFNWTNLLCLTAAYFALRIFGRLEYGEWGNMFSRMYSKE